MDKAKITLAKERIEWLLDGVYFFEDTKNKNLEYGGYKKESFFQYVFWLTRSETYETEGERTKDAISTLKLWIDTLNKPESNLPGAEVLSEDISDAVEEIQDTGKTEDAQKRINLASKIKKLPDEVETKIQKLEENLQQKQQEEVTISPAVVANEPDQKEVEKKEYKTQKADTESATQYTGQIPDKLYVTTNTAVEEQTMSREARESLVKIIKDARENPLDTAEVLKELALKNNGPSLSEKEAGLLAKEAVAKVLSTSNAIAFAYGEVDDQGKVIDYNKAFDNFINDEGASKISPIAAYEPLAAFTNPESEDLKTIIPDERTRVEFAQDNLVVVASEMTREAEGKNFVSNAFGSLGSQSEEIATALYPSQTPREFSVSDKQPDQKEGQPSITIEVNVDQMVRKYQEFAEVRGKIISALEKEDTDLAKRITDKALDEATRRVMQGFSGPLNSQSFRASSFISGLAKTPAIGAGVGAATGYVVGPAASAWIAGSASRLLSAGGSRMLISAVSGMGSRSALSSMLIRPISLSLGRLAGLEFQAVRQGQMIGIRLAYQIGGKGLQHALITQGTGGFLITSPIVGGETIVGGVGTSVLPLGTAAITTGTEAGAAAITATAGAEAGAAAGGPAAPITAIIGAVVGFIIGIVAGPLMEWFQKHKEDLLLLFAAPIILAGALFGNPLLLAAGTIGGVGALAAKAGGKTISGGVGHFLKTILGAFTGIAIAEIAGPLIAIIVGAPILIAFILFIINQSAYLVPPGKTSSAFGTLESKYVRVDKSAVPDGPFENDQEVSIVYTITISAKLGTLTDISFEYGCSVYSKDPKTCPNPTDIAANGVSFADFTQATPETIDFGTPYAITYKAVYPQGTYNDSAITDTFKVTTTSSQEQSSAQAAKTILIGTPPTECIKVDPAFPDNFENTIYQAIQNLQTEHPAYMVKLCSAWPTINIIWEKTQHKWWGYYMGGGKIKLTPAGLDNIILTTFIIGHETGHALADGSPGYFSQYERYSGVAQERPLCTYDQSFIPDEAFAEAIGVYATGSALWTYGQWGCLHGDFAAAYPHHYQFAKDVIFEE